MSDPIAFPPEDDPHVRRALRAAVSAPVNEVDWNGLHRRIVQDARTHFDGAPRGAYGWVSKWSFRGIPLAAASLTAAAVIALIWLPPLPDPGAGPPPPGAWPTAEELLLGLPQNTRVLLDAGADPESMITALMIHGIDREVVR